MSSPVSLCDQGKAHFDAGRWTESLSCLDQALDLETTNDQDKAQIHVQKGYWMMYALNYEQAKAEANKGKVVTERLLDDVSSPSNQYVLSRLNTFCKILICYTVFQGASFGLTFIALSFFITSLLTKEKSVKCLL